MNPFHEFNTPIASPLFDARVKVLGRNTDNSSSLNVPCLPRRPCCRVGQRLRGAGRAVHRVRADLGCDDGRQEGAPMIALSMSSLRRTRGTP
eukprot:scaffold65963_cov51-Phaeocystis_antarctica.AAC.1